MMTTSQTIAPGQTATFIIFLTPEEGIGFMSLKGVWGRHDKLP